jgi:hypothetical protein
MADMRAHPSITRVFAIDSDSGEILNPVHTQYFDHASRPIGVPSSPEPPREILQHSQHNWGAARITATAGLIVVLIGAACIWGWML